MGFFGKKEGGSNDYFKKLYDKNQKAMNNPHQLNQQQYNPQQQQFNQQQFNPQQQFIPQQQQYYTQINQQPQFQPSPNPYLVQNPNSNSSYAVDPFQQAYQTFPSGENKQNLSQTQLQPSNYPSNPQYQFSPPNYIQQSFHQPKHNEIYPSSSVSQPQNYVPVPHIYADFPPEKILSLVSIAENSTTNWRSTINYIEDINDGRGYTISIVGFCTGTGDFIQVVERIKLYAPNHPLVKFLPALSCLNGSDSHKGIEDLPNVIKSLQGDEIYEKSVFEIAKKLYWDRAIEFSRRHGLKSLLSQYVVYDSVLNFGELDEFESIYGQHEYEFMCKFLDKKQELIERDGSFGDKKDNRVVMQRSILMSGNMDLISPMRVQCYGDWFDL